MAAGLGSAVAAEPEKPGKDLNLPGITIRADEGHVDVEARVSLTHGTLELVACTKDTKEHESIVAVEAKPMHVHTALLLIGARPGNPAMRKPIGEDGGRWIDLPPRGGEIKVSLVFENADGESVERPIADFIKAVEEDGYGTPRPADEEPEAFPTSRFLFAGSHLHGGEGEPKRYLADVSGHLVTISTFGDGTLCLPGVHGHADGRLRWEVDDTHLPPLDSEVVLRLTPLTVKKTE
jgi:hypothetical protein